MFNVSAACAACLKIPVYRTAGRPASLSTVGGVTRRPAATAGNHPPPPSSSLCWEGRSPAESTAGDSSSSSSIGRDAVAVIPPTTPLRRARPPHQITRPSRGTGLGRPGAPPSRNVRNRAAILTRASCTHRHSHAYTPTGRRLQWPRPPLRRSRLTSVTRTRHSARGTPHSRRPARD